MKLSEVLHYYLPYKLHCICHTNYKGGIDVDHEVIAVGESYITYRNTCFQYIDVAFSQIKPILHLLSSLDYNFFEGSNIDIKYRPEILEVKHKQRTVDSIHFSTLKLCLENHLDIFSLIESGQAIEKSKK